MKNLKQAAILGGALTALILILGFFQSDAPRAAAREPMKAETPSFRAAAPSPLDLAENYAAPQAPKGLLALTNAPGYHRAGDLSLRVQDCTKAEDALETKLQEIRGEILEMLMEGTEGSRTCTLSVVIPADKFRGFIADLRGMGKIQSERITASKLKPGQGGGRENTDPDPRELSLVSIRMADEKVAQSVLESRGVLASSFDRGASHFMKGLAVLVEFLGLVLPFVLAFLAVAAPFAIGMRFRRAKPAVAAQ